MTIVPAPFTRSALTFPPGNSTRVRFQNIYTRAKIFIYLNPNLNLNLTVERAALDTTLFPWDNK